MATLYPGYGNQGALAQSGVAAIPDEIKKIKDAANKTSKKEVAANREDQARYEKIVREGGTGAGPAYRGLQNQMREESKKVQETSQDGNTYADGPGNRGALTQENYDPKVNGVPIPDSKEDPASAMQALSINQAIVPEKGNGTGVVPLPEPPSPQQVQTEQAVSEGKQVMFDMNKIPKPMESNAFNMGLMSFGLNLLSGNSYADAFNQASGHFNDAYGREKREAWGQDLAEQGYDAQDIQRWIETGDNKDLTDPMEKAAKQQAFEMGAVKLNQARYENSDEMRQYVMDKDRYNMEMDQAKLTQDTSFKNAQLAISDRNANRADAEFAYKQQQDWEKKQAESGGGKPEDKLYMSGVLNTGLSYKDVMTASTYEPSVGDYAKAAAVEQMPKYMQEYAKQSWTPEMHAAIQMRNQVSELLGRGLSGAALSEITERPTWSNSIMPTMEEIKNKDVEAIKRKENVFNAIKIYANSRAQGQKGNLTLNDVDMLGNGSAQIMVDGNGIPQAVRYKNGQMKQL